MAKVNSDYTPTVVAASVYGNWARGPETEFTEARGCVFCM